MVDTRVPDNEVIIDTKSIDDLLPSSVEAFFYVRGATTNAQVQAREVHASFLHTYGLEASQHPLMRLDAENLESPLQADDPIRM